MSRLNTTRSVNKLGDVEKGGHVPSGGAIRPAVHDEVLDVGLYARSKLRRREDAAQVGSGDATVLVEPTEKAEHLHAHVASFCWMPTC